MSLANVKINSTVRVRGLRGESPLAFRLMEMGLIEGATITVLGRAPLGDPLHLRLGDYELSLRAEEAGLVDVDAA